MKLKISFLFAWYDLWIGFYYDRNQEILYILPLPCLGLKIKYISKRRSLRWITINSTDIDLANLKEVGEVESPSYRRDSAFQFGITTYGGTHIDFVMSEMGDMKDSEGFAIKERDRLIKAWNKYKESINKERTNETHTRDTRQQ